VLLVDDIRVFRSGRWCHVVSDLGGDAGRQELRDFITRLGITRKPHHPLARFPHYDLHPNERLAAIRLGAQPVSSRDIVQRLQGKY
jgi:hypothetical protein